MKSNKRLVTTLTYVVLNLGSILKIFPFVWMFTPASRPRQSPWPFRPDPAFPWNFDNFVTALASLAFVNLYVNTAC
jgi:multiple sugar transport system permease protein